MFGVPSLKIGRLFGIPVEVNASWLVIFLLVAASLSFTYYPTVFGWTPLQSILAGVVTTLLFFVSVVIHEISHSLVAQTGGLRINKITLFLFGGIAEMTEEPKSPGKEFAMAAAGPGMSLVLAAIFFVAYVGLASIDVTSFIWGPLQYLFVINLAVALFNLLPGFPLDGGRVLRAAIWGATGNLLKATLWASRAGQVIGYAMIAGAVFGVLNGNFDFIWFGLIGWFLTVLADSAYRQQLVKARLSSVRVADIMTPNPEIVSGDQSLEQLAHDHFLGGRHSRYPVAEDGKIVGIVSLSGVKEVPRDEWSEHRVAEVADKDLSSLTVRAEESADHVMGRLASERPGALLVIDDGSVVGIVTKSDLVSRLRRAELQETR